MKQVPSSNTPMHRPGGSSNVTIRGFELEPDDDGTLLIPNDAVKEMQAHGYVIGAAPKAEKQNPKKGKAGE